MLFRSLSPPLSFPLSISLPGSLPPSVSPSVPLSLPAVHLSPAFPSPDTHTVTSLSVRCSLHLCLGHKAAPCVHPPLPCAGWNGAVRQTKPSDRQSRSHRDTRITRVVTPGEAPRCRSSPRGKGALRERDTHAGIAPGGTTRRSPPSTLLPGREIGRASCRERVSSPV